MLTDTGKMLGDDLLVWSGTLMSDVPLFSRLGGKGGSFEASYSGAIIEKSDPEEVVAELAPVLLDVVDRADTVELVDVLRFAPYSGPPDASKDIVDGLRGGS